MKQVIIFICNTYKSSYLISCVSKFNMRLVTKNHVLSSKYLQVTVRNMVYKRQSWAAWQHEIWELSAIHYKLVP